MASMFGWKADRSVLGASAGWLELLSTATTWSPAPMANSISVAVGDSDTIRLGCGAAAPVVVPSWPQAPATRARTSSRRGPRDLLMHPPLGRRMRGPWESEAQPALPPRTELAATEAGDLARPRRGRAGPHSCGTAPGSH